MKRICLILIGTFILCVQYGYAQTPCEKSFSEAKRLYARKNYHEAKIQFQDVIKDDCGFESAQEYIKLCDEWIEINNREKKNHDLNKDIASLESQNKCLRDSIKGVKDSIAQQTKKLKDDNYKLLVLCQSRDTTIRDLQDSITNRLLPFVQEKESLETQNMMMVDSLRAFGRELNAYLESKWLTVNKEQIVNCDSINDAFTLIKAMRDNLYLVTKKK